MSPVKYRRSLRSLVKENKDRRCKDCLQKKPYDQMSYDHVRGEKHFNLGGSLKGKTLSEVLNEIEKCDVVCLDCHKARELSRLKLQQIYGKVG